MQRPVALLIVLATSLSTFAQTLIGPHRSPTALQGLTASVQSRFTDAPEIEVGAEPRGAVQGDFNHDGKADIAVVNQCIDPYCTPDQRGGVTIELGNGDGTFQSPVNYFAEYQSVALTEGDFNGDGNLDLAVVNCTGETFDYCGYVPVPTGSVSILLGNGDGTFQPPVSYGLGDYPRNVVTADFNGDGKLDLAVAVYCGTDPYCRFSTPYVSILIGQGDGSFRYGVQFPGRAQLMSLATGDFNHDGKIDIAAANRCGRASKCGDPSTVSISLGNGDGTFQRSKDYASGNFSGGIAVGDFNGDSNLDLAVEDQCTINLSCVETISGNDQGVVAVLLGNGDGTFQPHVDYNTGIQSPERIVVHWTTVAVNDFNGDQIPDLAVADDGGEVSFLFGKGDGTFKTHVDYGVGGSPNGIAVGDFNGDGKPDLAVANEGDDTFTSSMSVVINNGDGTFRARMEIVTGEDARGVAAGDFNRDGIPDFAVADYSTYTVSILLGNGTSEPSAAYRIGFYSYDVVVADFNHDGNLDIAVANSCGLDRLCLSPGSVSVLLGNGDGTFGQALNYTVGQTPHSLAAGDINGDGLADLVVANNGSSDVTVLLSNADGTFFTKATYPSGLAPEGVTLADLNGDGKLDIVTANQDNTVGVSLGNGDGTFQAHVDYATGQKPMAVTVADFNRDDVPDLATADGAGFVSILLGKGDGSFPQHTEYATPCPAYGIAVGDFLGRKLVDVVTANFYCGSSSVLLGNGDGTLQPPTDYANGGGQDVIVVNGTEIVTANVGSTVSILRNLGVTHNGLSSSPNPSKAGQQVTFTAKVVANIQGGQGTPTGKVTFKRGSLMKTVNLVNGVAQFTTSVLKAGTYKFTASYPGDSFFNPSVSATITQNVNP